MQQTDYPRTRPDMPNHEPRGCRVAPATRYLYSANRLKYPLMRKRLMKMWREAKVQHSDPVGVGIHHRRRRQSESFKQARGRGGFVRSPKEVNELIAASNVYTVKTTVLTAWQAFADPGDVDGLLRFWRALSFPDWGTCLSFYDWYCDRHQRLHRL